MNVRRCMFPPSRPSSTFLALSEAVQEVIERRHVRFGSLAEICSAKGHVRFAPIATAKGDSRKRSCPIYPRTRTLIAGSVRPIRAPLWCPYNAITRLMTVGRMSIRQPFLQCCCLAGLLNLVAVGLFHVLQFNCHLGNLAGELGRHGVGLGDRRALIRAHVGGVVN